MSRPRRPSTERRDVRPTLALGLIGVGIAVWAAAVLLGLRRPAPQLPLAPSDFLWAGSFWAFLSLGAWIARKRPDNPVGWCLALGPICIGTGVALFEYAADPGRAGAAWVGLAANPVFDLGIVLLVIWSLWYPDGSILSRRWGWLLGAVALVYAVSVVAQMFTSTPYSEGIATMSPLAAGSARVDAVHSVTRSVVPLVALSSSASLVIRFRRGDARIRDQLKLLLYAVIMVGGAAGTTMVVGRFIGETPLLEAMGYGLTVASLLCVPTAVAIAIVRHRALDIDRAISRTVSYAVITAIAVGAYAASVLGLGNIARALTGESGDLVVALSTLLVAAAFQPVRRRVQAAVDRRFNRGRVDGLRAADDFARRLRDEVDLDAVVHRLRGTVVSTLEPAGASVLLVGQQEVRP